jgi:hypothetical protein
VAAERHHAPDKNARDRMMDLSLFRGLQESRRPGQQDLDARLHQHLAKKGLAGFDDTAYIKWLLTMVDLFEDDFASQDQLDALRSAIDVTLGPQAVEVTAGVDKSIGDFFHRANVRALLRKIFNASPSFDCARALHLATGQDFPHNCRRGGFLTVKYVRWPESNTTSNRRPSASSTQMTSAGCQHPEAHSLCESQQQRIPSWGFLRSYGCRRMPNVPRAQCRLVAAIKPLAWAGRGEGQGHPNKARHCRQQVR